MEYTVGALCDLIASKGKKKKTAKSEIMIENDESHLQSVPNQKNLLKDENVVKSKKRKLKKNSNDLTEIQKKKKLDNNTLNIPQDEPKTFDTKPQTSEMNNQEPPVKLKKSKKVKQIKEDTNLVAKNESNTSDIITKKKKNKKSKVPLIESNETSENEKKKFMSKVPDIKSSADYIEKESRTIFVGNVPVNVKMSAIKNAFKKFGEIETTRLRSVAVKNLDVPKRVSIMKGDFHPQRDTANVYVRFKTIEQAQKALDLNATKFEGHIIRVDMALNSGHKQNKKKGIFIGNLPYNIQEDEIWDFFKDCGTISAVRIVRDNSTGVSKGFGYVDFETKETVELAIQLQGKRVQNREIRIKRIETKSNTNKKFVTNQKPIPFKKSKPLGKNVQNFQGEFMKPKSHKKKPKPTKTDLQRRRIAKKLNA